LLLVLNPINQGQRFEGNFFVAIVFVDQVAECEERITMTTRTQVRSVVSDAQDKGRQAVEAVSDVRDNMSRAIDKSLDERPYTTLLMAVGIGFLLGALWAR
jgi:ElaB/YqjD/DUF883 family membrane-anchored ribosome-binding protein